MPQPLTLGEIFHSSDVAGNKFSANDTIDFEGEFLKDTALWFKLMRIHKYTSCFSDLRWYEIIDLDDGQLERLGVTSTGARKKLRIVSGKLRMAQLDGRLYDPEAVVMGHCSDGRNVK